MITTFFIIVIRPSLCSVVSLFSWRVIVFLTVTFTTNTINAFRILNFARFETCPQNIFVIDNSCWRLFLVVINIWCLINPSFLEDFVSELSRSFPKTKCKILPPFVVDMRSVINLILKKRVYNTC